ncbi:MAG: hypothetical protein PHU23_16135 [Dehalococcoidales bacterium]|nr:hypothetical protein [Dehalococcoidales bacterium]
MTASCAIRDLLAKNITSSAGVWRLDEKVVSSAAVQEIIHLGEESTFLNAMGLSPTEDNERLQELTSLLESDQATQAWYQEGQRWRVSGIMQSASEVLPKIANSLRIDANPGRIGRLLRALPVLAGSQFTPLGANLSRVLDVEPLAEVLILAYGKAFCQRDEAVLAAIDRLIISDRVLGPVAVELTSHLLGEFNFDRLNLDPQSREALIDCLVLLVSSALEKVEYESNPSQR